MTPCSLQTIKTSLIIFIQVSSAYLITDQEKLLNSSTGERVRLKCVNWYGAHQEPLVPGGLELVPINAIVDLIVQTGANCVRIPLSDRTVLQNPSVGQAFIGESRDQNFTAMEALDAVVGSLTARGLMVILNSHTSVPGWVGSNEEIQQGLWHRPGFSTADWIHTLVALCSRYAHNKRMVGIDLRNEIHDQDGTTMTWGESDDVDSDWLAATTAAERAIAAVNPNALIIVSGLCRGYDLRHMVSNPGPTEALRRKKLIYTTHVYTFSWWWTRMDSYPVLQVTVFIILLTSLALVALLDERDNDPLGHKNQFLIDREYNCMSWTLAVAGSFLPFACIWIITAYLKANIANSVGCGTIASESHPWLAVGIVLLIMSIPAFIICYTQSMDGNQELCFPFLLSLIFWIYIACMVSILLIFTANTYWMVQNELSRWCLEDRKIPVWVGEFGTGVGDHSWKWRYLTRFLRDHDLDFAYWALNGRKWQHGKWEAESFGLLTEDYKAVKNQTFTDSLFRK